MNGGHGVAIWAGFTTLFANLAAVRVIAVMGNEASEVNKALASLITSVIVAAGVYSRQRWLDAKKATREHDET